MAVDINVGGLITDSMVVLSTISSSVSKLVTFHYILQNIHPWDCPGGPPTKLNERIHFPRRGRRLICQGGDGYFPSRLQMADTRWTVAGHAASHQKSDGRKLALLCGNDAKSDEGNMKIV